MLKSGFSVSGFEPRMAGMPGTFRIQNPSRIEKLATTHPRIVPARSARRKGDQGPFSKSDETWWIKPDLNQIKLKLRLNLVDLVINYLLIRRKMVKITGFEPNLIKFGQN